MVVLPAIAPPANGLTTVIVELAVFTHPLASVPVTVYVVVVVGLAVTVPPVVADNPVDGLQE